MYGPTRRDLQSAITSNANAKLEVGRIMQEVKRKLAALNAGFSGRAGRRK